MKPLGKSVAAVLLGGGAIGGYFFGSELFQDARFARAAEQVEVSRGQLAEVKDISTVFRAVGKVVEPSVVKIDVTKTVKNAGGFPMGRDDMIRRFFPDRDGDGEPDVPEGFNNPENFEQQGTGSGVIMDIDGSDVYILTNNHVASNASEISITLNDGRQIDNGKVVGTDPKTDLALVKIQADRVIAAKWGDSDKLEKGDWIMAFGSPFGYVGSMTHGIVSALNRTDLRILGRQGYENFIQVDAPINPGNSGGPLTNLHGEVVGINTAIATRTGSFSGIGFAIPSNMAKYVYASLKGQGKVVRGWLGVGIEDISREPDIARSFGYKGDKGVLVTQTFQKTPAAGKLQEGDIITGLDGKALESAIHLREMIASTSPGKSLKLDVFRGGKTQDVEITLGEQPEDLMAIGKPSGGPAVPSDKTGEKASSMGLTLINPSSDVAAQLGLKDDVRGAVVGKVAPNSSAAKAGFQPGDIITRIGGEEISSSQDANKVLSQTDVGKGVRFYVTNGDIKRFIFVKPGHS